jgi:predicted lipoprotein with Yx(FWY)xxD motif
MTLRQNVVGGFTVAAMLAGLGLAAPAVSQDYWRSATNPTTENYVEVPMPPGFTVEATELDGPVFADSNGKTLYRWQLHGLRNGDLGDRKGQPSSCTDKVFSTNSGLMSPYPGGYELPELDTRPSCVEVWPPVLADDDAEEIGKWTVLEREDGTKQWAFDEYPLYTSVLDNQPGDVLGGTKFKEANDGPAVRQPVGPSPNVPPAFAVAQVAVGRMLVNFEGYAIYTSDGDGPSKSNCVGACLKDWAPALAPGTAQPQGEWTFIERSPGIRQWVFRDKPLYTYIHDPRYRSYAGSDVPGWQNIFTQRNPAPPEGFTIQDGNVGQVLADSRGLSIYVYNCGDDAPDQLACDHPGTTQAYRLAICGGGNIEKCHKTWPYVLASKDAKANNRSWSVMAIDPHTGHHAAGGQEDALRVWAYRGRPVFNFGGDRRPGDTEGDSWGEFNGYRNGFKAFWLRDDFLNNAG